MWDMSAEGSQDECGGERGHGIVHEGVIDGLVLRRDEFDALLSSAATCNKQNAHI